MFGFSQYNFPLDGYIPQTGESSPVQDVRDSAESIFDLIFAVDPVTGLPSGIISQYLSDKTSADVKEFIERTFKGISSPEVSVAPEEIHKEYDSLSTSLVADLSRNRFESVEQYEERIKSFLSDNKAEVYRDKLLKDLREKSS